MHNQTPAELNPSSGLGGVVVIRYGDEQTDIHRDGWTGCVSKKMLDSLYPSSKAMLCLLGFVCKKK